MTICQRVSTDFPIQQSGICVEYVGVMSYPHVGRYVPKAHWVFNRDMGFHDGAKDTGTFSDKARSFPEMGLPQMNHPATLW